MLNQKIQQLNFKPNVLGEQVAEILTEAILDNVLEGGQQLVEVELQKQFGISRSPVREAFRDLEKKGLVEIIPRKGTFVKKVTSEDIARTYPIRAALEALAAQEAHRKLTGKDLEKMSRAIDSMERYFKKDDKQSYWKQHFIFHEIFINACGNDILINILHNLRMSTHRFKFSRRFYQDNFRENLVVHKKILKLFQDVDSDGTELVALMKKHIEDSSVEFIKYLENMKDE